MINLIKKAFTLIELLVVIAIIGILSGLIVVSMSGVTAKANIAKAQVFSNSLRNSLMNNIVAEWKFDGTATDGTAATNNDVLDSWGGVNDGTVGVSPNTPTVKTGSNCVSNSCLSFDGSDIVDFGNDQSLHITSKITIGVWVYPLAASSSIYTRIIEKGWSSEGSYILMKDNTDKFRFTLMLDSGSRSALSNNSYPSYINQWHYIAAQYDGSTVKMYIDGALQNATSTYSKTFGILSETITIGGANSLIGTMDDIRVFNDAITISQIKEQYYSGLNSLFLNGGITKEEYLSRISNYAIK